MTSVMCDVEWCENGDGVHCSLGELEIKSRGTFVYAICMSYKEKPEYKAN